MADPVDTSINGRIFDPFSGHELIVVAGQVTRQVNPGNDFVIDAKSGAGLQVPPGFKAVPHPDTGYLILVPEDASA